MQTETSTAAPDKKLAWWQVLLIGAVLFPFLYLIKAGFEDLEAKAPPPPPGKASVES
jgi:hypothetical protein